MPKAKRKRPPKRLLDDIIPAPENISFEDTGSEYRSDQIFEPQQVYDLYKKYIVEGKDDELSTSRDELIKKLIGLDEKCRDNEKFYDKNEKCSDKNEKCSDKNEKFSDIDEKCRGKDDKSRGKDLVPEFNKHAKRKRIDRSIFEPHVEISEDRKCWGHWPKRQLAPENSKKKYAFLMCKMCSRRRKRVETSYRCGGCPNLPALCPECFQDYHELLEQGTID